MSDITLLQNTYHKIINQAQSRLTSVKRIIYRISSLRVFLFLAGIAGLVYFREAAWWTLLLVICVTFIPFLALVKYHNRLFYKKEYAEKEIEINHNELAALSYDLSGFDGGKEYTEPSHLFSYDLDLFGDNSLFRYINRTSTLFGKKELAKWFIHPLDDKEVIEGRQQAIRELTPELAFRQRFQILGLLHKGEAADEKEIREWIQSKNLFYGKKFYRALLILVPALNALLWILAIAGTISFNIPGLAFVIFVIASFSFQKSINKLHSIYGKKLKILATYAGLMEMIEKRKMEAPLLLRIQGELETGSQTASTAVKKLSDEMNTLDQRNNMLLAAILNGLLFWELRQIIRIERWKGTYAAQLPTWLRAVGKVDALCSLATFAYNHPDYTYPVISTSSFTFTAKEMGHPLMHRDRCVKNEVDVHERPSFIIITGANMAGKSTYLRTIGVNYVLACMGSPVCCSYMELYPAHLITSLRTTDSLTDNESYFFAELKRLKLIIDKLEQGEELFIILDEILKGTNSTDKQKGSFALIRQLMNLQANGIIATHDLLLGQLAELFPYRIFNYCFEAEIHQDELAFSYRLKEGVAQNMNACFLMKKMGIVVDHD